MGGPKSTFSSVELSFIVHGTEDEPKLLNAMCNAFRVEPIHFEKSTVKGYFGNQIIYYKATIKREGAESIFNKIFNRLPTTDMKNLLRRLDRYVDRQGHLFLRIDKQNLLLDRWLIGSEDSVRLKFKLNKWGANIFDWKQIISQSLEEKMDKSKHAEVTSGMTRSPQTK